MNLQLNTELLPTCVFSYMCYDFENLENKTNFECLIFCIWGKGDFRNYVVKAQVAMLGANQFKGYLHRLHLGDFLQERR